MSTSYNIIKLNFHSPVHIGMGKDYYDFSSSELHADALTAALAAVRAMNGKTEDLETFLQSFTLSSAFPFHLNEYFLPKPVGRIPIKVKDQKEETYRKGLKGIKFIERDIWNQIINGKEVLVESQQLQGDFLVCGDKEFAKPYQHQVSQRVAVCRNGEKDATPFFFDWTCFNQDSGFYCLTDAKGNLFTELVNLFIELGENGIGSDRNIGGGHFTVTTSTINFSVCSDAQQLLLLSPYIPTEEEHQKLNWKASNFNMILRGGYMAGSNEEKYRHLWKRSVYMVNEGAMLVGIREIKGKVIDLSPEETTEMRSPHPVYRSGRPFYLPIKMKET